MDNLFVMGDNLCVWKKIEEFSVASKEKTFLQLNVKQERILRCFQELIRKRRKELEIFFLNQSNIEILPSKTFFPIRVISFMFKTTKGESVISTPILERGEPYKKEKEKSDSIRKRKEK